jgi:hypothetical protein
MSRRRIYILAACVLAAGLGASWLALGGGGGGGDRAMAQDAPSATQPQGDRNRDRDGNSDRGQAAERRGDRGQRGDEPRDGRRSDGRATPRADERRERRPSARAAAPKRREDFAKQFAVVYEKNIFLRDRPAYNPNARDVPTSSPTAPRRPEESYVLTGIVLQEGRHVAFIENTDGGGTQRVLAGGAIAVGKVADLDLDALEYEAGGKRTRIAVGHNLAGAVVFTPPPAAAPPPPPSTASAGPGPGAPGPGGPPPAPGAAAAAPPGAAPNTAGLSVEEQMRLRRAQKLGGK